MTNRPTGTGPGIFSLFFGEAGLFSEQAWQWVNQRAEESRKYIEERALESQKFVEERARETGRYMEGRSREGQQFLEEQAKQDRVLNAEADKIRLAEAQTRKAEAEARLLEQIRLAKQAGLDVDSILTRVREEKR